MHEVRSVTATTITSAGGEVTGRGRDGKAVFRAAEAGPARSCQPSIITSATAAQARGVRDEDAV